MDDPETREEQIVNLIRDFYENDSSLVIGGFQDNKDPTIFNFLVFSHK